MTISHNFTISAATASVLMAAATANAHATIKFCNKYREPVYVAIAYQQTYSDGSSGYLSRGWLQVASGSCQEFDTSLHVPSFFYRGETNWFKVRGGQQRTVWENDDNKFLTTVAAFNYWDADKKENSNSSNQLVGFIKSLEASNGDISETVTFEADGIHDTQDVSVSGNDDSAANGGHSGSQ